MSQQELKQVPVQTAEVGYVVRTGVGHRVGTRAEGEGVSTVSGAGTSSGVVESCDGGDSGNKSVDETR